MTKAKADEAGRRAVTADERRRVVVRLVAEGVDAGRIRSRLVSGITLPDGRELKVSAKVAQATMREVAAELAATIEDDDLLRIEVAASVSRVKADAKAARTRTRTIAGKDGAVVTVPDPDFQAAIRGERVILDFAARVRPERYERALGRRVGDDPTPTSAATDPVLAELREKPLDEVLAEAARRHRRLEALGLSVPETKVEPAATEG